MSLLRSIGLVVVFAAVLSCLSGCGSDDTSARAGLKAAGALVTPGGKEKPVDGVTLSTISDASKLEEAIAFTGKLSAVKTVRGQGAEIKDSHLETFGKISTLIDLNLNETGISDAGIKHLAGAKKLFNLGLYGTDVTDACLEDIGKITTLHILNIGKTKVTGDLSQLANLQELEWIVVSDLPELPDAAIDTLCKLPNFSHLQMTNTKISPAALEKLRKARPGIAID